MSIRRSWLLPLSCLAALSPAGCANLQSKDPVQVLMVGIEPLKGQGLEVRMLAKLRIQNPNDSTLEFNGVYLQLNVQGKRFASGVSDTVGTVPRYGETLVDVPVSISMLSVVRQVIGLVNTEPQGKLQYELSGKLSGTAFKSIRFKAQGELAFPPKTNENSGDLL